MTSPSLISMIFGRRVRSVTTLLLGLLAVAIVFGSILSLTFRPEVRVVKDLTRTRAYSLSPKTTSLLESLDGPWSIALVMIESRRDETTRAQVDQVLGRFEEVAPNLTIDRIDPTDPETLATYEQLLERLRNAERGTLNAYEASLDNAESAFRDLILLAQRESPSLESIATQLPANDPTRIQLTDRIGMLGQLASQGDLLLDEVERTRRVDESRPLPQLEEARSILQAALQQFSDQLLALAEVCDAWMRHDSLGVDQKSYARGAAQRMRASATELIAAADPLLRLPRLQLSSIGAALAEGEAAVIIGPGGSAVIPSQELFPGVPASGGIDLVDRRFRGETVIASTIRAIIEPVMPMIVFVHAEPKSMLRSREGGGGIDFVAAASELRASRYRVEEWSPANSESRRPVPQPDQPVAWIICPPLQRAGFEIAPAEETLLETTRSLILTGEAVMLNHFPSLRPKLTVDDPWAELLLPFGISGDTGKVIFALNPVGMNQMQVESGMEFSAYEPDSSIGAAVNGQPTSFALAVPLVVAPDADDSVGRAVVAAAPAGTGRWLEEDWVPRQGVVRTPPANPSLAEDVPMIIQIEATHPNGSQGGYGAAAGTQRILAVGAASWLLSVNADASMDIGGGRVIRKHPGNHDLLLSGCAWLTGEDDRIRRSAAGSQIARLEGITAAARRQWSLIVCVAVPLGIVILTSGVWFLRRRSA